MARILLVDDDPDILKFCDRILRSQEHTVVKAESAMKAMDLLNSIPFDSIISDARMPQFSGFELVRSVKANKRFAHMSIAMLTGLREKQDIEKAIRAGVDDYIVKPIDPNVFVKKVEGLLQKKPPQEQVVVKLPEQSTFTKATCNFDVKILNVSEQGLTVKSPVELFAGMTVDIASDFFKKVGIPAPVMKIADCHRLREFEYETRVIFVNVPEPVNEKIRKWIHGQQSSVLNKAA